MDIGAKYIPQLDGLANLLDDLLVGNPNSSMADPISPTVVTDKGLVAYVTANSTTLTVG